MRVFIVFSLAGAGLFGQVQTPAGPDLLSQAEDLYGHTDYQASLSMVRASGQPTAAAYYLMGRDHFMLGDYGKAAEAFERAFRMQPTKSDCALWLGRSWGRRAETSMALFAPKYAAKARGYFETAVALDPKNEEALNDLFDYYLEAPGFLGGGFDKAEQIAKRIGERNPAQGDLAEAKLADRRRQFDTAEEQIRRVIEAAPRQVGRVLDLARNLGGQGRIAESEAAFDQAERLAPNSPQVRLARARTYVEQKRNLDQAKALLNQYLQSDLAPGDPTRQQAEELLREASGA
jgi:tetratricopeptide (TPR) repeat protein